MMEVISDEKGRLRKLVGRLTGLGWVKGALLAVAVVIVAVVLWTAIYRLFFASQDAKHEHAANVTQGEVSNAAAHTTDAAINAVEQQGKDRETVRVIVTEGRSKVNEAWHGETVGEDVDRAGADALCKLHDDLCRGAPAAPLQPVRERVPGGDAERPSAGE